MSRKSILLPLILLFFITSFISCVPDEFTKEYSFDVIWEPSYNGPVAFGNFTIKDILEEMLDTAELEQDIEIDEDATNLYYVSYSDSATAVSADTWFKIANQYFPEVFFYRPITDIPAAVLGNKGDTIPTLKTKNFDFTYKHHERLDSIDLKQGMLYTDVWSTLHHSGYLVIHCDKVILDGEYYRDTIIISDTTGTFENHTMRSLDGAMIYLDNQKSMDTTFLEFNFDLYLVHSGNDIKAGEEVLVNMSFMDMKFKSAYGYLGNYDTLLADNDTLDFELFDYEFKGNVYFGDPRFNFYVDNSIGAPLGVNLFDFSGQNKTGQSTEIVFVPGTNPFVAQGPDFSQIGETVSTLLSVNNTNSNINEITNTNLSQIVFSLEALTGIEGPENRNHFVFDDSKATIKYEVVLPMDLRAEDFELEDTIDLDLSDIPEENDTVQIDTFQIRLATTNTMPVEIYMQVIFVDEFYNVIDSLFVDGAEDVIRSPVIEQDGKVTQAGVNEISEDFTDRLDKMRDTRHAFVRATFETAEQGQRMVKFYSYSKLSFKLGTKIKVTVRKTNNK
jgi:hypothetical protein